MAKRPYDLPSVTALVCFEAAARHVSFKTASRELNVTPAAVSHQVKALEQELGRSLFRRHHRGVELTESGAYLFVALQRGFEDISETVSQLRSQPTRAAVTIRSSTAISALWVTPRLAQFWKTHGNVSVSQIVTDEAEVSSEDCDLSIHYGESRQDRHETHILFHDRIAALASPGFCQAHQPVSVTDLARLPLIHLEQKGAEWTDWREWFAAQGYSGTLAAGSWVNNYIIGLQAAQDDMGAILGWQSLTRQFVDSGRLVQIVPEEFNPTQDFYIRVHPRASDRARQLCQWLLTQA